MRKWAGTMLSLQSVTSTSHPMSDQHARPGLARGAYLLPNALTTGALMAGFYAIVAAIHGDPVAACIAVVIAGLLDGVDGRVARLTNTQSEFGVQYDSLSDMVSFGIAPAVLVFSWALDGLGPPGTLAGKLGWLGAFFFTACAALRLARFNTQAGVADKRYFQGLASPAAAGTLISVIWFCVSRDIPAGRVDWVLLVITVLLATLMVSRVRYFSFKARPVTDRVPFAWIFLLLVVLILLAIDPPAVMFTIGLGYVASGLVMTARGRYQQRRRRRNLHDESP